MWLILLLISLRWLPLFGSKIPLGGTVNLLSTYGNLNSKIPVISSGDYSEEWLFREYSTNIFENVTSEMSKTETVNDTVNFHGHFQMELCDDFQELLKAYFRNFSIEDLDKPWQSFIGSWKITSIARLFGINTTYVTNDYRYILVRISRIHEYSRLLGSPQLVDFVKQKVKSIVPGNTSTVNKFITSCGSHYVASYTTGNSLYQVFVYNRHNYELIKGRVKRGGTSNNEIRGFFSPFYSEEVGRIQVSSGNVTVRKWASDHLREDSVLFPFSYPSLLRLSCDNVRSASLKILNELLQNEIVLQLELKTLARVFQEPTKQLWFEEVLGNTLNLWEVNIK